MTHAHVQNSLLHFTRQPSINMERRVAGPHAFSGRMAERSKALV